MNKHMSIISISKHMTSLLLSSFTGWRHPQ